MTYKKPELEIEKFDIVEDITADGASADGGNPGGASINSGSIKADENIGSDLIIG